MPAALPLSIPVLTGEGRLRADGLEDGAVLAGLICGSDLAARLGGDAGGVVGVVGTGREVQDLCGRAKTA